jgi:hypothetical protein
MEREGGEKFMDKGFFRGAWKVAVIMGIPMKIL